MAQTSNARIQLFVNTKLKWRANLLHLFPTWSRRNLVMLSISKNAGNTVCSAVLYSVTVLFVFAHSLVVWSNCLDSWETLGEMPQGRDYGCGALVSNSDNIVVVGWVMWIRKFVSCGLVLKFWFEALPHNTSMTERFLVNPTRQAAHLYNAATDKWTLVSPSPIKRDYCGLVNVNGRIFSPDARSPTESTVLEFLPTNNTW